MKKSLLTITALIILAVPTLAENKSGFALLLDKDENNIFIKHVIPNSNAHKLGLKSGQKIIKFNGKKTNKIKNSDIENIDSTYKTLKLVTEDNKQYNLKLEDINLLNSYNQVQNTYCEVSKYIVSDYKTEKIILSNNLDNKHIRYANAYLNYANAISLENSKLYTELFKVTKDNVLFSKVHPRTNPTNTYTELYNSIYRSNKIYDVHGQALKDFLELAMYNEENLKVINRQVSEFNNQQKEQLAQIAYNTRIVANLYSYANRELNLFLIKNTVNRNTTDKIENELKTENNIYNLKYKQLCDILNKNKIKINKPGPLSNRQQITAGITPNTKWADDKEIIILAQEKGYNPSNSKIVQKSSNIVAVSQPMSKIYKEQIPLSLAYDALPEEYKMSFFNCNDMYNRWKLEFRDAYVEKKYKNALRIIFNSHDNRNIPGSYLLASLAYNGSGDIGNAIKYLDKVFTILDGDGYTLSSGYKHPSISGLYSYRAYLYLKTGDESNLELVLKNIDNAIILGTSTTEGISLSYNYQKNVLLLYELLDDKNISSYMKHRVYQHIISKSIQIEGTYGTIPIIANYIEYIYSLDDNDPLFAKYGTNKTKILNSYIDGLRGKYAPIAKGIFIVASGQFEQGIDIIYNFLHPLERKYPYDVKRTVYSETGEPFAMLLRGSLLKLRSFNTYYNNLPKARILNDIKIKTLKNWLVL